MGFAGLYETWSDPSGGEIDTACIVTTAANRLVGRLHDRMPAILEPESFAAWLDVDGVDAGRALALLKPAPEEALELVEIGPAVNRVANDDESLQKPVAAPIRAAAERNAVLSLPGGPSSGMTAARSTLTRSPWPSEKSRRAKNRPAFWRPSPAPTD